MPEGHGIFPSLTVKENIVLNSPKGKEKESLVKAGDQFPVLAARMGQRAGSLSGGEQQMLALVRASLMNPRIVVVDEASLGLSPTSGGPGVRDAAGRSWPGARHCCSSSST